MLQRGLLPVPDSDISALLPSLYDVLCRKLEDDCGWVFYDARHTLAGAIEQSVMKRQGVADRTLKRDRENSESAPYPHKTQRYF